MRSLACAVFFLAFLLAIPGCAAFNKKSGDPKAPGPSPGNGPLPAKFPGSSDPLLNGGSAAQGYGGAVLAGRVIDNFSNPPGNTSIRLVSVDGKETGKPTEVNVTADGYFTIQGLKSGSNYKLVARGKTGDHLVAGITYTRAPNLTVVIQVRQDFANSGTPDVLGSPAYQDKDAGANNATPTSGVTGPQANGEYQTPSVNVPGPGKNAAPASQDWQPAPNLASDKGAVWPPPLEIPNPVVKPAPPPLLIPKTPPPAAAIPPIGFEPGFAPDSPLEGRARVPSCVLLADQLVNFALNDVNGNPWELKRDRKGKLLLIDFWSTTCIPCKQTIPSLIQLQYRHGSQGLEVLGIAIESGGTPQEQGYRVNSTATKMSINYRQLLSSSAMCPVCEQFNISKVPTTVLVDRNGRIIWRHVGVPDRYKLDELDRLIQSRLRS